jgi:hypothetical protein
LSIYAFSSRSTIHFDSTGHFILVGASCTTTTTNENTNTNQIVNVPAQQAVGPYSHEICTASSTDGLSWQHDGDESVIEHASVPIAIRQPNDTIMVYYVDASNGPDALGYAQSTDEGETVTPVACLVNDSVIDHMVDFSIVQLETGQYCLYYFGSAGFTGDPASNDSDHLIYKVSPEINQPSLQPIQ